MRTISRHRSWIWGCQCAALLALLAGCGSSVPSSSPIATPSISASPAGSATSSPGPTALAAFTAAANPPANVSPLPIPLPTSAAGGTCTEAGDAGGAPSPKIPRPNGWPVMLGDLGQFPVFAPDGTMYLVWDMQLHAIDKTGHEPAGWPKKLNFPPMDSSGYVPTVAEMGPDGTVYVTGENLIYAYGPRGLLPGWPYRAPVNANCTACTATLLPTARGLYTDVVPGKVVLLRSDATPMPGWSVTLPESYKDGLLQLWIGPDGTLYVDDPMAATIYAYDANGAPRAGWPLSGWGGMTFDPSGRIYVWKYRFGAAPGARYSGPAIETQIARVDPSGKMAPGWPIEFDGSASVPSFGPDGTVYVTRGNSGGAGPNSQATAGFILAFDPDGRLKPGWPVSMPSGYWVAGSEPAVNQAAADPPTIGSDGTVYVIVQRSGGSADGMVEAFDPAGKLLPGWPRTVDPTQLSNVLAADTGSGWLMTSGVIYLVEDNKVVALRSDGTLVPGWPLSRPCGAATAMVETTADGGLLVVWNAGAKPYEGTLAIRYRADGSQLDR